LRTTSDVLFPFMPTRNFPVGASSLVMVVCPWTLPMDNAIAATIEPSLRMAASTPKATRWS
jgi:hypothetical protein